MTIEEVWEAAFAAYQEADYEKGHTAAIAVLRRHCATAAELADPVLVHVSMLRGGIAKPSSANIWHIYGRELLDTMPDDIRHHLVPRATGDDGELEQAAKVVADEIAHLRFGTRKTDTPERQGRRLRRFEAALKSMEQAADRITALSAEVERLTENAKANNQLARMYKAQADEFRAKYVAAVGQD